MDRALSISLHQLHVFTTVVREGGFARAAETLLLSTSSVSGHIRSLENAVGLRLIERGSGRRQVELTEAGAILLKMSNDVFADMDRALSQLKGIRTGEHGEVRLAMGATFFSYYLLPAYQAFQRIHPEIELQTSLEARTSIVEGVLKGTVDLGVVSSPPDVSDLESAPLLPYDLVLVGPSGHPLSQAPKQSLRHPLKSVQTEPIILPRSPSTGLRRVLDVYARDHGVHFDIGLVLADVDSILQAVEHGLGITALSVPVVIRPLAEKRLSLLCVDGFPVRHTWHIVYPKRRMSTHVGLMKAHLLRWRWTDATADALRDVI